MEEMKGMAIALSVLGEKIANLEEELRYARLCKGSAETTAAAAMEENKMLHAKLNSVEAFMEKETLKEE